MRLHNITSALLVGLLVGCIGPTAGTIELPRLDETVEAAVAFRAGTSLSFAVHADSYDYSGADGVLIDVTLLRGGVAVAHMQCLGFELEGGAGCGSGATHLNSDCALTVPEGGSDRIQVRGALAGGGQASFEGLAVYLRD